MNPLKKLAGETAWYGLSSIVGRLINYLLLPFYTNATLAIFQPADYGVLRELYAYVALLNIVYTFGMETTYFRYASKYDERKVFNQATSFILAISFIFSGCLVLCASMLVNAMGYEGKEIYIYYLAALIAIDAIVAIPFAQLRWEKRPKRFAMAKLTNIFLNIFLNVFFLLICRDVADDKYMSFLKPLATWIYEPSLKVGYVFLANLIANALFFVILRKSFVKFRFSWDQKLLKEMVLYAYPLIFMGFAGLINSMADVYFIKYYMPDDLYPEVLPMLKQDQTVGQYMLGAYNACIKFAVFMMLVVQAYRYAAEPFFFSKKDEEDAPQLFAQAMNWFVIVACFIMISVSLNVSWLKDLLIRNDAYYVAIDVVPFAMLGNLLMGVYFNFTAWFKLVDKTKYGTYLTFIGAAVTVISNFILIPFMGVLGAAISMIFTYLVMSILCYIWGQKYFYIPYDIKKISLYILLTTILVFVGLKVSPEGGVAKFLVQNIFTLAFLGLVIWFEKKSFLRLKSRLLSKKKQSASDDMVYRPPTTPLKIIRVMQGQWLYSGKTPMHLSIHAVVHKVETEYFIIWGEDTFEEASINKTFGGYTIEDAKEMAFRMVGSSVAWTKAH